MKRLIKLIVLLVAILVIGGIVAVMFVVNSVAKTAVERGATYALGVETTLGSADVRIIRGEFDMNTLRVANPEGFTTQHFMTLGDGGMAVKLGTLRQETVEVPLLHLTGINMNLEKRGQQTNYNTILENLKRLSTGEKPAEDAPGQKKFVVNEVRIRDVEVHMDVLPLGGELTRLNLKIPEILLHDVGSDTEKGVVMSELSGIIMRALFAAIVEKGGDLIPIDMLGDLTTGLASIGGELGKVGMDIVGGTVENVTGALGGIGGKVGEGLGGVGDKVGEGLEGIGKGLGGLFGGEKKDEEK